MSTTFSIDLHRRPHAAQNSALARMAFGRSAVGCALARHDLESLDESAVYETWATNDPVTDGRHGPIDWRASDDLLFGAATVALDGDIADITSRLYRQVFECAQACGFEHLLRVWHFLPQINVGDEDRERYKQFCMGRALAFDTRESNAGPLPAGTAIGTLAGDDLLIYFLAARTPGAPIENPRQVSAFDYPRRYGPRPPLFSRAMVWPQDAPRRLIVSGTASIVGHESQHADDLQSQLEETWRNIGCLCERAGAQKPLALRVYLRHRRDHATIRAFVEARLPAQTSVIYLHADICRAELLVEIEGVYAIPGTR